jgi:hypothetical protein
MSTGSGLKVFDLIVGGNLLFSTAGATGNVILKTGSNTQTWGSLPTTSIASGSANQVLVMNPAGTSAVWSDDLTLPGDLVMPGVGAVALLPDTQITYSLKLGGNFTGSLGTVCVADGSSVPHWEYPQYYSQWYDDTIVDMNGAATVVMMKNALINVDSGKITYTPVVGTFSNNEAGNFLIRFETLASTSNARTRVNFRINGVFVQSTTNIYIPGVTEFQPLVIQGMFKLLVNSVVEIVTEPVVAGVINTSGDDSHANSTTIITFARIGAYI